MNLFNLFVLLDSFIVYVLYGTYFNIGGPKLISAESTEVSTSQQSTESKSTGGSTTNPKSTTPSTNPAPKPTNKSSSGSGFSLNLSSPKDDDSNYSYSKAHGTELHIFRITSQCAVITCDSKELWKRESNGGNNPSKVRYDKKNNEVTIYFGETKHIKFIKQNGNWTEYKEPVKKSKYETQTPTSGSTATPAKTTGSSSSGCSWNCCSKSTSGSDSKDDPAYTPANNSTSGGTTTNLKPASPTSGGAGTGPSSGQTRRGSLRSSNPSESTPMTGGSHAGSQPETRD